jgi:hypothetical protein
MQMLALEHEQRLHDELHVAAAVACWVCCMAYGTHGYFLLQ